MNKALRGKFKKLRRNAELREQSSVMLSETIEESRAMADGFENYLGADHPCSRIERKFVFPNGCRVSFWTSDEFDEYRRGGARP